jgi:hypothetical protein
LEQRLEAFLEAQPQRGIPGFLPVAGGAKPNGRSGAVLRQNGRPRACLGGRQWQDTRGQQNQALGRSRGGKTDLEGNPLNFHLTGGEASDTTQFETSLDPDPDITPRVVMTGKGYDSRANRAAEPQREREGLRRSSRGRRTPGSEIGSSRKSSISFEYESSRR